jgi:hypothetical protein
MRAFALPVTLLGLALAALAASGCSPPSLTRDGQLVFSERGRGAAVLTADGLEIIDPGTVVTPRVRKSAYDPWTPPLGFLLPPDGVLRRTSKPTILQGRGLAVVVRASDRLAPTWGGELLVRVDVIVPSEAFPEAKLTVRRPCLLAVILDDDGMGSLPLVDAALSRLGERDRVTLIEASRAGRLIVPPVPGTHRTLLSGATERVLASRASRPRERRALADALLLAERTLALRRPLDARVLLVTDGLGVAADVGRVARQVRALRRMGARVVVAASSDRVERSLLGALGDAVADDAIVGLEDAERALGVLRALPPPGAPVLTDVELAFSSAPAPARIVEASGGRAALTLEEDYLALGTLRAGEARTEVVRLALPVWTPGEPYRLTIEARYRDRATGSRLLARGRVRLMYDEDLAKLAQERHGDVIADASALAMVRRLERAMVRDDQLGSLEALVHRQASSLSVLAERTGDSALGRQAEALATLADALGR